MNYAQSNSSMPNQVTSGPNPAVSGAYHRTTKALDELHEVISHVEARIASVCRPTAPEEAVRTVREETGVQMADAIHAHADSVEIAARRLNILLDRISL